MYESDSAFEGASAPVYPSIPGGPGGVGRLERKKSVRDWASEQEMDPAYAKDLETFASAGYRIVLLADNSGSMGENDGKGEHGERVTRWQELAVRAVALFDLIHSFCPELEIYFLNPLCMKKERAEGEEADSSSGAVIAQRSFVVRSQQEIKDLFSKSVPSGYTPLTEAMQHLTTKYSLGQLLLIVATDGDPNNPLREEFKGKPPSAGFFVNELYSWLKNRDWERVRISFMACTDDEDFTNRLDKWDADPSIKGFDVVDDFQSEAEQYRKAQLSKDPYKTPRKMTRAIYLAKTILGPIYSTWDKMDASAQKRVVAPPEAPGLDRFCAIL